jgi:ABC transport system ATP-binding/permease protein
MLARSALFAGWSAEMLASASARFRSRAVSEGETVCVQDEPGDEMYVVEAGRFAVDATLGERSIRLAELGPGAVLGEIAVVAQRPRSATVTALTPGQLWALRRADFRELAVRYPSLGVTAGRLAAARLGDTERQLSHEPRAVLELRPLQDALTIGRDPRNDLVLDDPRVSRRHALLRRVGDSFRIEDLGSTNGSFLNGRRVDRADLREGDHLQLGGQTLRFAPAALTHYTRGRGAQVDAVDLVKVVGRGLTILAHVALSVYPGELVAIVGGSGAGKTTLLNALAGVSPPSRGRVLYDGDDFYQHFPAYRQLLGYVPQDDIVHPELSVYRTLYFAARLRLPTDTSRPELEARIARVLDRLELAARRDTPVRSLSGGQRKRVSIGVELLTEPEVFYLDEPTSGLDPGLDLRMMELLRSLADQGRTVILTTHATRNVMLCDKVAFMARGGHLAFYGPPAEALAYFGVDDFVQIYRRLEPDGAAEQAAARFAASEPFERYVAQRLDANALATASAPSAGGVGIHGRIPAPPKDEKANIRTRRAGGPGWARQLFWLTARYLAVLKGDPVALAMLVAAAPLIALVMGSTFDKHPFARTIEDGGDVSQAIALIFVVSATAIFLGSFVAARSIAEESAIYARERLVNLAIVPYALSKVTALSLFALFQSAALVGVVALRLEIPGGARMLVDWFGVVTLISLASLGMGLLVSALSTNTLRAMLLHSLVINPQLILCGALVPLKQLDSGSRAVADVMIGRWAVSLLGYLNDVNGLFEAQFGPIPNDYAEQFDLEPRRAIAVFVTMFLVFVVATLLALKRRDVR